MWNFRGKDKLIAQGVLKAKDVSLEDLGFDGEEPGMSGMTAKHRQWYSCQPAWPGGGTYFFNKDGYLAARADWKYPLHCIDFETSAVAIPFVKNHRPYEVTAFQFSHHVIHDTGRVEPSVRRDRDPTRYVRGRQIPRDGNCCQRRRG
ncbi:DUF2779 domain-containing protein [Roseateles noduli]|uniref:DUF2779 domain-containing protein n=1 Tax=Roseateles noduli TaxID=2052484 RepID=UPI003D64BA81